MHVTHYVDFLKKNSLLKRINISTNQVAILFSFEQVPKKNDNTQSKGEISMNIRKWNCNHEAYDANERINCSSAIVSIKSRLQQSFVFRVPIKTAKTVVKYLVNWELGFIFLNSTRLIKISLKR